MLGLARSGAWAQLVAVSTGRLAPIPHQVTDAQAAALPTAGLTALRSLEIGGLLLGKRVLVTGATGGAGRIAHASGAQVTALVRDAAGSYETLRRLGAGSVVEQLDDDFDFILDGVGGATFGLAIEHLTPRGVVVNIATADDGEAVTFRAKRFDRSHGATIYTLNLPDELAAHASAGRDLTRLCTLVADGRLDPQIAFEGSWRQPAIAIDALLHRRIGGKAVLHIDADPGGERRPGQPDCAGQRRQGPGSPLAEPGDVRRIPPANPYETRNSAGEPRLWTAAPIVSAA